MSDKNLVKEFIENSQDVQMCDWYGKLIQTVIVENDELFMREFNRRVKRFKKLFIEDWSDD